MRSKAEARLTAQQILRLLARHRDELGRYGVKRIGLFGSHIKNEQTAGSDIDFLVDFEEPSFDDFMELAVYLERVFGRKVEILTPAGVDGIRVKSVAEEIKKSVEYVPWRHRNPVPDLWK
jgi:hypothetical protein